MACDNDYITCRIGESCAFLVTVTGGIDARYTALRFVALSKWGALADIYIDVDQADMEIDYAAGTVQVNIPATETADLSVSNLPSTVPALLRFVNPGDAGDVWGVVIPFVLQPGIPA